MSPFAMNVTRQHHAHHANQSRLDRCVCIRPSAINKLYELENESRGEERRLKLRLIGSSFGGLTAGLLLFFRRATDTNTPSFAVAFYATQYPDQVDSLLLLCPSIKISEIIQRLVGKRQSH